MSYETCRERIRATLATIPGILRVYEDPPATLQDAPAIIMYGDEGSYQYAFGGRNTPDQSHTELFRLLLKDAALAKASNLTRDYQALIIEAFRDGGGSFGDGGALRGQGTIERLEWGYPTAYDYGSKFTGRDYRITFWVLDP